MVVRVRHEPQRHRDAGQHQRPPVQVGDRPSLAVPHPRHPVVEVVGVRRPRLSPVLEPLGDDESGIEERHGEDDQRHHQSDDRAGLHRADDRNHAEQVAEQVRPGVAHERRCRREVVKQEPERRPRGQRREHGGAADAQVERDDRERDPVDRAQPGREPVDAVREVHDVHQPDQPDHGQHPAGVRELKRADERERDVGHDRAPDDHGDHRRGDLAEQLPLRPQRMGVVDRAHQRDQARTGEDRPHVDGAPGAGRGACCVVEVDRRWQPQRRGDEHAGEDREAAQRGRVPLRQAAVARGRDSTDPPRQPCGQRGQQGGDRHRHEECEQCVPVPHAVGEAWQGRRTGVVYLSVWAIRAMSAIASFVNCRSVTRRVRSPAASIT